MYNDATEKILKNQIASAEMEGYCFSAEEIVNVRKCLDGEMTVQQFVDMITGNHK